MVVKNALKSVRVLYLDTAPVIYVVEAHPQFGLVAREVFVAIDRGEVIGVTSYITLMECLVLPYKTGNVQQQRVFTEMICSGKNTRFARMTQTIAKEAARFRAVYNLSLTDAIQIATALEAGCDAFLTNDKGLRRVTELNILVLEDLTV